MPPVLVLINGLPASGKSTLGRQWCARHASQLPLCLDIDVIRSMVAGWREASFEAGSAARDIALAAIATHLGSGRDVVVPQFLGRPDFVERLRGVADAVGAGFVEVVLTIDPALAAQRFTARARDAGADEPWGRLTGDMTDTAARFDAVVARRPGVVRIAANARQLDELEQAVDRSRPS
ncbi:AAA family ATPase [Nakamurella flava]|nr:AAA family ATPase [Nakamurella flava]